MKRRIVVLLLSAALAVSMTACGGTEDKQDSKKAETTSKSTEKKKEEKKKDIPEGTFSETGTGTMYISTPGGTSENGEVPVLYASEDEMTSIGLDAWEFDGSKLSFIYIDGVLNSKEQLADTQTSLTIEGDAVKEGTHIVEVLQFDGDEPSSTPVTYKKAEYEVKQAE